MMIDNGKQQQQQQQQQYLNRTTTKKRRSSYYNIVRIWVFWVTILLFLFAQYFTLTIPMMMNLMHIPTYSSTSPSILSQSLEDRSATTLVAASATTDNNNITLSQEQEEEEEEEEEKKDIVVEEEEEDDDDDDIEVNWLSESSCKILFHIHIPKTAGTSILTEFNKQDKKSLFIQTHEWERKNTYWRHGKNVALIYPTLKKKLEQQLERQHRQQHQQNQYNKITKSLQHPAPILISAEVGINDLIRNKYPYFNETCFFTVLRDPHSWLLSAVNHMKFYGQNPKGIYGKFGFLDTDNIQSTMSYYNNNNNNVTATTTTTNPHNDAFEDDNNDDGRNNHSSGSGSSISKNNAGLNNTTTSDNSSSGLQSTNNNLVLPSSGSICAYSVKSINNLLCAALLNTTICDDGLGHINVKNHTENITDDAVKDVVQTRFQNDLYLWDKLNENNGRLCW